MHLGVHVLSSLLKQGHFQREDLRGLGSKVSYPGTAWHKTQLQKSRSPAGSKPAVCRAGKPQVPDPFKVLGIHSQASRAEIRAAYLLKIKEIHPDLNAVMDTTDEAVELNAAYATLIEGSWRGSIDEDARGDAFDKEGGALNELFVNPFACSVSPYDWQILQDVARGCPEDPESALTSAGVRFSSGAIQFVTAAQLQALEEELTALEDGRTGAEVAEYYLFDCLQRARKANARQPVGVKRWG